VELSRATLLRNAWKIRGLNGSQGRSRTADTRIFSPVTVAGLCVTIGRYMYLFKRLTAVQAGRFYQFEHIETSSSGKVVAKYRVRTDAAGFFTIGHAGGYLLI